MTAIPAVPPLTDETPPINSERLAEIRLLFVTPTKPEHHDDWLARVCMQSDAALELLMALDIAVLQATAAREEITALRAREDDTDAVLEAALPGWSPDRPPAEGVQQLAEERDQAVGVLSGAEEQWAIRKVGGWPILRGITARTAAELGDEVHRAGRELVRRYVTEWQPIEEGADRGE